VPDAANTAAADEADSPLPAPVLFGDDSQPAWPVRDGARSQVALAGSSGPISGNAFPAALAGPEFLTEAGRRTLDWARRRSIGVTSACGISLAMAICATAWFSAGSRTGNIRGVAALWIGYLVALAARKLGRPPEENAGPAGERVAKADQPVVHGTRTAQPRALRLSGSAGWFAALGACLAECIVYAGLSVGATAERWSGVWPLASAVVGLVAVRDLMTASSSPPGLGDDEKGALHKIAYAVLTMPAGGRVLLIGVVAPIWGARAALFALLDWAIISIGYGLAGRVAQGLGDVSRRLVRLRDDGVLARSLGRLVKGNLMPLPPAVLGLAAISTLAILGLHGLPGILIIGPAIIMLLAAPGSSNRHAGRFDWLVPVLLLAAQYLYLTATGVAARVPGPVVFALCTVLLLRYCDLAFPGRPSVLAGRRPAMSAAERGSGLGWEGRILLAGVAAAMGIATFAYLALTLYFGALICAKVLASCLVLQEEASPRAAR